MKVWHETDVRAGVALTDVITSLETVLTHEAAGTAWNVDKTMATWPSGPTGSRAASAHAVGAVDLDEALVVFKTWVNTPDGAASLLSMFSAADGAHLGVAPAAAAGALRTAAASGVATRCLADPGADEMALLGAGRQALHQVAAVAAVRPLRRVRVWSRSPASATDLAERVHAQLGIEARTSASIGEATADAPIVTTATRARDPFLGLRHLAPGAHVNAIGAILPTHAELEPDVLVASALTVVDSEENAQRASRELREHREAHPEAPPSPSLAEVAVGKVVRPAAARCTVFKGMGMGLSDLAVARLLAGDAA